MVVHTTNSLPDGDEGNKTQEDNAAHATLCLCPQLFVDPQTQHFRTTNCDCAFSGPGTSQVLCPQLRFQRLVAQVKSRVREPKPTEKTREKLCLHCPAKLLAQSGEKENNTAAPAQHRQKDVFGLHTTMHLKTGARQRNDVGGPLVHVRCRFADEAQTVLPHSWMTCLQKLLAVSLDTSRHCISQCTIQCATTTDAMFHVSVNSHVE